jgi:hypothetical protein
MGEITKMALILMEFQRGYDGDLYQENINNVVTRWLDKDGNEVTLSTNGDIGVAYSCKDSNPPIPSWYVDPQQQQ